MMNLKGTLMVAGALALGACGGGGDPPLPTALKVDMATFSGNGIYWNPAEPGTGFFFEAQGDTGVITFFVYDANGRPEWYTAPGYMGNPDSNGRHSMTTQLLRFTGGQAMQSTVVTTPVSTIVGTVTVVLQGDTAQVTLPGRSFTAERLNKSAQRVPARSSQPETGIYWNPAESGRGYVIEVNADVATVGAFLYTADGQPTWSLVTVPMPGGSGSNATGDYVVYSGGQTLSGAYRAPSGSTNLGKLSFNFSAACAGQIGFPGMPAVAVQRYGFGGLPNGGECRSKTVTPVLPGY